MKSTKRRVTLGLGLMVLVAAQSVHSEDAETLVHGGVSESVETSPTESAPAPVIVPTQVALKDYKLVTPSTRGKLPAIAASVVIVPNSAKFKAEITHLMNSGLTFQDGKVHPDVLGHKTRPWCTLKYVVKGKGKDDKGRVELLYHYAESELIEKTSQQQIVSHKVFSNYDKFSKGHTMMMQVRTAQTPSDTVELIQCMVSVSKDDLYVEPSAGQIAAAFGDFAKVYYKPKARR